MTTSNRPSIVVCTDEGLFIWPGVSIASLGMRRSQHEIGDMLASLHGSDVLRTKVPSGISLAAELVRCGRFESARKLVAGLPRLPLSRSGNIMAREIAARLGIGVPALPVSDGEGGAALSAGLAKRIAASLDRTLVTALRLETSFCAFAAGTLSKGDWDPSKHPRAGDGPNPGWFAPVDGEAAPSSAAQTGPTPPRDLPEQISLSGTLYGHYDALGRRTCIYSTPVGKFAQILSGITDCPPTWIAPMNIGG